MDSLCTDLVAIVMDYKREFEHRELKDHSRRVMTKVMEACVELDHTEETYLRLQEGDYPQFQSTWEFEDLGDKVHEYACTMDTLRMKAHVLFDQAHQPVYTNPEAGITWDSRIRWFTNELQTMEVLLLDTGNINTVLQQRIEQMETFSPLF